MNNYNRKNYKKGAALVEFAILTTIMVPLLLYITFFSELLHFRMKIDEMGYFAAWELSSYGLSDYSRGTKDGGAYNDNAKIFEEATKDIKNRTYQLYHNLDSADPSRSIGYLMITPDPDSFSVTMEKKNNVIENNDPGDSTKNNSSMGGGLSSFISILDYYITRGINYVAGKAFGFNTEGMGAKVTASGGFNISSNFNANAGNRDTGGFSHGRLLQDSMLDNLTTYKSKPFTVWVDTWAVKSGADVDNTDMKKQCFRSLTGEFNCDSGIAPYAVQVSRMSLMGTWWLGRGVRAVVNAVGSGFTNILKQIPLIGSMFGADENPAEARMVSKNYYYNTTRYGNHEVSISKGQSKFQTSPLVYIFRAGGTPKEKGIVEYKKTLEKRRNFYMGNNKPNCKFDGIGEQCQ